MAVVEALAVLAELPADLPLCFSAGGGVLVEVSQVDVVAAVTEGDRYTAGFDRTAFGVARVSVAA